MKVRHAVALGAFILLAAHSRALLAQTETAAGSIGEITASRDADLDALRQSAIAFAEAFNRGDAKGVAALWTTDGEFVDDAGGKFVGREEIEKEYAAFFAANPKATIRLMIESLRLLSSDAAIEDGQAVLEPPGGAATSSKYSVVHVKAEGRWLMASVRDAPIDTGSAYENIADLEWLIGTWVAEEHGVKTESVCRWLGRKSFVERTYTTTGLDGSQTTGVQIIGWNAQDGHVQSWNFSPDGAVAVGIWAPIEDGWQATVSGTTLDGIPTAAVNHMQRLDDDAYVWQSVERSLGETALPDSDEVIIRRSPVK